MRVLMIPTLGQFKSDFESGIRRVVEAYHRCAPEYDIEYVETRMKDVGDYDLLAIHAGMMSSFPEEAIVVSHLHGLYWSGDYQVEVWQHAANRNILQAIRYSKEITVPSEWVAHVFERDMRFRPHIVPHGIEWEDWQHEEENKGYVLWNKNRKSDACSIQPLAELARKVNDVQFVSTFSPPTPLRNVNTTGILPHHQMKRYIQQSGVYLSTARETFGIGVLEAMASGVPVLAFDVGGNRELVRHGETGYLAKLNDYDDLAAGLGYCLRNRRALGENGRELAKEFTWGKAMEALLGVYQSALTIKPPSVGVVIPCYNKEDTLERAVNSALSQNRPVDRVVIVDDGSTDDSPQIGKRLAKDNENVIYIHQENAGVAEARNRGVAACYDLKYAICLDADDWIKERYVQVCMNALETDQSLTLAYTKLWSVLPDGREGVSNWPSEWNFDRQVNAKKRLNQVPTCCMFEVDVFRRLGGYKSRYCPTGAGSEDANLWARWGAHGYKCELVSQDPLFVYTQGKGHTAQEGYHEIDWLALHPWSQNGEHPFASYASAANGITHLVRHYDSPVISVIIPVGPDHVKEVENALDSLEAQTFRDWEAILVFDGCEPTQKITDAYPYAKIAKTGDEPHGAGAARNVGAAMAKAPFLFFLDADDWLYGNESLSKHLQVWNQTEEIVYADYIGIATVEDPNRLTDKMKANLMSWDEETKRAVIRHNSLPFDCNYALRQPDGDEMPYIWASVTALIPRAWHEAIGGFDESMWSWEDVDYHWRMVKAGYCYHRIEEPLMAYRFYSGARRQVGLQNKQTLLKYLIAKHEEIEITMAKGCCGGKRKRTPPTTTTVVDRQQQQQETMNDADFEYFRYNPGKQGSHSVVGAVTRRKYGYHKAGDVFLVHKEDAAAYPGKFLPTRTASAGPKEEIKLPPPPTATGSQRQPQRVTGTGDIRQHETVMGIAHADNGDEDEGTEFELIDADRPFDLQALPGISGLIAERIQAMSDIESLDDVLDLGIEGLADVKGVGPKRAEMIIEAIKRMK